MECTVCKILREHPEAQCFIVDVGENPEATCVDHSPQGLPFRAKDYLALNEWAGTLPAGIHPYQITG